MYKPFSIKDCEKILPLLMMLALPSHSQNEPQSIVIEADNHEVISENLTEIDENTIVVFDCDDTLI